MHSLNKGKAGEREFAKELGLALGVKARRGVQYQGSPDSPDIVCKELEGLHFEVKRVEKLNLGNAMAQAVKDSGEKIPLVAHRRNRDQWLLSLRLQDLKAFSLLVSQHLHTIKD